MRIRRHPASLLGLSAGLAVLIATPQCARADWGMGMGWGWGFGVGPSASTNFLNQHALTRAAGGHGRRSNNVYGGNHNAYINRVRDNGYVSHYDARRRRSPSYQPERRTSLGSGPRAETQPVSATVSPPPIEPLANFFDASLRLVWPHESPGDGEFKEKRVVSDQASLAVLTETKQHGAAAVSTATDARQKLVTYGRPALQQLRATATSPIADSFHRFLLSLYDSLEASAAIPGPAASSAP